MRHTRRIQCGDNLIHNTCGFHAAVKYEERLGIARFFQYFANLCDTAGAFHNPDILQQ